MFAEDELEKYSHICLAMSLITCILPLVYNHVQDNFSTGNINQLSTTTY